jgi:hypothetical protein
MLREELFSSFMNGTLFFGSYIRSITREDGSGYSFIVELHNGRTMYIRCLRPGSRSRAVCQFVSK